MIKMTEMTYLILREALGDMRAKYEKLAVQADVPASDKESARTKLVLAGKALEEIQQYRRK